MEHNEIINKIGAILFMFGKPVKFSKISRLLNLKNKEVEKYLLELKQKLESDKGFLKLTILDEQAFLTVREPYSELARKIVDEIDLPKSLIETLSVIAILAPVEQSEIIKLRNNKAYDHISQLDKMGFVKKTKSGRTFTINLTKKFFDYFDIDEQEFRNKFKDRKDLKQKLSEVQEYISRYESEQQKDNPNQENLIQKSD